MNSNLLDVYIMLWMVLSKNTNEWIADWSIDWLRGAVKEKNVL